MAATSSLSSNPELVELKRKLTFAKVKRIGLGGGVAFVLVVLCMPLTAEAARNVVPFFGTKLSKTPVVGTLFSGPSMAKVDSAYIAAGILYAIVLYFWRELLSLWLDPEASANFNERPYKLVVTVGGVLILFIDAALMYVAIATLNWGKVTLSFVALLFTIAYVVGLVFASLVAMRLRKEIRELEQQQ